MEKPIPGKGDNAHLSAEEKRGKVVLHDCSLREVIQIFELVIQAYDFALLAEWYPLWIKVNLIEKGKEVEEIHIGSEL